MRKIWGVALILALGCGDDKNPSTGGGTDESTGGTSGGTTTQTTDPTSTGTTDNSGTMGGTQTTDPTSTSTSTTTTTTETTTSTTEPLTTGTSTSETSIGSSTGGGGGMIEDDCMAACDKFTECQLGPDPEMCVPSCLADLGGGEGECVPATEAYLQCIGSMTCDELVAFFQEMNPGPCGDELQAFGMACQNGGDCSVGQGGNPQGTECEVTIDCMGEPPLAMQCDKDECVCLIDGMPAGDPCPSEMICKSPDALMDKANTCCGFMP